MHAHGHIFFLVGNCIVNKTEIGDLNKSALLQINRNCKFSQY